MARMSERQFERAQTACARERATNADTNERICEFDIDNRFEEDHNDEEGI